MPVLASPRTFLALDRRLRRAHGTPERRLGNLRDPLAECIFIILSFQTEVVRARAVWRALRGRFSTFRDLSGAKEADVARVLQPGGLHRQKARAIQTLLEQVRQRTGRWSLRHLKRQSDEEAERVLLGLHGLSWKGARCVLMYSLGRDVFPVDVNAFRILKRMGIIPEDAVYRRRALHDAIQEAVPPSIRRSLHVNLVIHGQEICLPARPRCSSCVVKRMCARIGVADLR